MAFAAGKKFAPGLDNGDRAKPKNSETRVKSTSTMNEAKKEDESFTVPSIRPGESLSDFAARVDAAIPVSGLIMKTTKGGKDPLGLKVYRTLKEKKMHRLYDQWRAEERKIQERREEQLELAAEQEMENGTLLSNSGLDLSDGWHANVQGSKGKKKRKGKKNLCRNEEDPWEELRRRRGEDKPRLRDVAQAPPILPKISAKLTIHEESRH